MSRGSRKNKANTGSADNITSYKKRFLTVRDNPIVKSVSVFLKKGFSIIWNNYKKSIKRTKETEMKKSIMRAILILGALILGMNVWVEKNFQSNFIYYSHNLSHPKDQYPFIGILMDYVVERGSVLLDDEMFLGLSSDKDGFSELYDIYYKDLKISNTGYKGKDLSKPSYVIVYKNQVFELNIKTEIIEKELSPDNYDLASLNNVLSNFGEQMLQQSSIPIFNLQWLFNIKYSERFH